MRHDLIDRYSRPVPRYTSYPTAPHFREGFPAETYSAWLAGLEGHEPVSLYVHIPYCDTLCWFCGCHTKITMRYSPVATFVDALVKEIALVARHIGKRLPVGHIHWGGGSPTMLEEADMKRISDTIRANFDVTEETDFAVEIDPRGMTQERIDALAECGLTRASIGIQDANSEVQLAINRYQPMDETAHVADMLRRAGIGSLNLDLVYGLPYQTKERVIRTVDLALEFDPDRIALFGYAHVPWMKRHQRMINEDALPGVTERFDQAEAAAARLVTAGMERIGLDHFAKAEDGLALAQKAGTLHRNFQGYTTDTCDTLIGFGASSIGSLPGGYIQNLPDIGGYQRAVFEGRLPVGKGFTLSRDDIVRREMISRIMCNLSLDIEATAVEHGFAPEAFSDALERLQPLAKDGLVEIDGWKIVIPDEMRPLMRNVAAAFDSYLNAPARKTSTAGRHSLAV